MPGTLTHILWDCPQLKSYWVQLLRDIDTHFDNELTQLPTYIILGLPNALTFPLKSHKGWQIVLAQGVALQNILSHWGSNRLPSYTAWLHPMWYTLGMERISLSLAGRGDSFSELWGPFLSLLSSEFNKVTCPKYLRLLRLTKQTHDYSQGVTS